MFRIVGSKQTLSSVVGLRLLLTRRAMGTRCNAALLRPPVVQIVSQRNNTQKDLKDIEDFLKQTKLRFFEINQQHTEGQITKWELTMLVGSIVFFLTLCGCYLYLYKKEFPTEIEYEKFASDSNLADAIIEEEKKKTWKDHPLLKEV